MLTGCTTTVTGSPTKVVADSGQQGLDTLVPTADEVAAILRSPPLEADSMYDRMPEWDITTDNPNCLSAIANTVTATYADSGYLAVYGIVFQEASGDELGYDIDPAVVQFRSPADAQAQVARISAQWQSCGNAQVGYTEDGVVRTWLVAEAEERNGVWATVSSEQPDDWTCSRAIGSESDIVADVRACGYGLDEGAAEIAHNILGRVAKV
jgi:hypothetical protein